MQLRPLGRSGLNIAPLMIGANVFGWTADRNATFKVLDAFIDAGVNGIDTANTYSNFHPGNQGGESETLIGEWMKATGKRNRVVLATKVGHKMQGESGLSRQQIEKQLDNSLRRLGVDYIDLYQSHYDDPETPQEETLGCYADFVRKGKIRAIGCSNFTLDRILSSLAISAKNNWPRYETMQPEYSLMVRNSYEGPLQDLCVKEGIGAITFFALASGFLSGKYRSAADLAGKTRGGRVEKYLTPRGLGILAAMDEVSAQTGAPLAQIALAWIMTKPGIAAPIASATSEAQVKDLVGALTLSLSAQQIAALDAASAISA